MLRSVPDGESTTAAGYLGDDEIIQVFDPRIQALARTLRQAAGGDIAFARASFGTGLPAGLGQRDVQAAFVRSR